MSDEIPMELSLQMGRYVYIYFLLYGSDLLIQ